MNIALRNILRITMILTNKVLNIKPIVGVRRDDFILIPSCYSLKPTHIPAKGREPNLDYYLTHRLREKRWINLRISPKKIAYK